MVVSLSLLFEALSIVYCLHYLYGEKLKLDVVTIAFILIDTLLMVGINYWGLDSKWSIMIYPIIIVYCGMRFGLSVKPILINNILYVVILCAVQATIMLFCGIIFSTSEMNEMLSLFISLMTFLIIVCILRKCKLDQLSKILQSREWITILSILIVAMSIILFLLTYRENKGFDALYYLIFSASVLLIGIAAIDIGKHKMKMCETQAELRLHKLYEKSFQNLIDDICARQHEFDNHINTIYSQHFLYKTYDELVTAQKEYCKDIVNENHYNKLLSKGNPIVLGFLYGKFLEAEKKGIDISYKINIGNLKCNIPIYKIVELLGNLIKNAVEALENEQDINKLQVVVREENDVIFIKVANESNIINFEEIQQFFKKGYSKKGNGRGYGLYNVKRICDEYKAEIQCNSKNDKEANWLIFSLLISKSL